MKASTVAPQAVAPRPWVLALGGVVLGAYSAMCGIGGGVFAVPWLVFGFGLPMPQAVANSLVLVAASTSSATAFEALHPERALHVPTIVALVLSALLGTYVGYRLAQRLPVRRMKQLFTLLLLATGVWVLLDAVRATDAAVPQLSNLEHDAWAWCAILGIGFVSGVLAPMMGIGGGLVAVPGLVYLVPDLGYLGARAASLTMSTATAWTSVFLYQRDGTLQGTRAVPLALGAAAGAALGIQLVHVDGVATIARGMVSLAMFAAAARFLWDLRAQRASSG